MKKLVLILSLFLNWSLAFSQAVCFSDQSNSFWKINESLYGSKRLSDCHVGANYNCHGFVMSYFENGCTSPGWNKTFLPAPYSCPTSQGVKSASDFKNSGKYLQVCNEADANIAFYNLIGSEHSAVREVVGGSFVKYISKYGTEGPLVAHNLNQSFYHLYQGGQVIGSPEFWTYVGPITGSPQTIIGTNAVSYNVINRPGVTYNWSIVEGYSKAIISSSTNQSTVTVTPIHSGTAKLRLTISSSCGQSKIQEITLTIQTNVCLEGDYSIGSNTGVNLNSTNQIGIGNVTSTVTCPNANSFTWERTSGSITTINTAGNYVTFNMVSGGSISFKITARNGSTILSTRNVSFFNFGSFKVYPNPSSEELTIDLSKDMTFDLLIQGIDANSKSEISGYRGGEKIDISDLPKGDYILKISFEGKMIHQERLILSK
ncbi:T9SS type A sorting domain-containing protein [Algoriphagus marincola]|uniref:T9SS type A sorting domain-containing protein n=1 Tax=Algoriphagus marincola TaxID=264027 RepID=UPI0004238A0B|nr:T9SS type A sorting domain-containing protein [Algoriphagus marincola]